MKLEIVTPKKALNKAYLKEKVGRTDIELLKNNLTDLFDRINEEESEEHLKNLLTEFLKNTWYKGISEINTKGRQDLAIHNGNSPKESVGVIIEVKRPSNKNEMITDSRPNAKAMHELILYYLRERIEHKNIDIKHLAVTNIYEWFIFDENWFEINIFRDNKLKKAYESWKLSGKDTRFFYENIASPFLENLVDSLPCTYFDLRDYYRPAISNTGKEDIKLIGLFKVLSPVHLLKQAFANDSNSLDSKFYSELLNIIGLEEVKESGKKLIKRKEKPDAGSLLENAIIKLEDKDCLRNLGNLSSFGNSKREQYFNISLELCITWINRVLFLKLLEAQLFKYHKGNKDYLFLNSNFVVDFDELNNLFFQVLAEKPNNRREHLKEKYEKVPYLNSSLFERTELERQTIDIGALDNRLLLPLYSRTVLKDASNQSKRKTGKLLTLQYLFEFLDSYDFSSEGSEEIQEENKNLINASVLGLIFEKINGYKDGSFFTPGFITMYMCREAIRRAVVQKFNSHYNINCEEFKDLKNFIGGRFKTKDILEFNSVINELRICDPAVGSGHFLVSALNELIVIKADLGVLADKDGIRLSGHEIKVENDELIVTFNDDTEIFQYTVTGNSVAKETQRIQKAIFHEKETIIENCLFGVDINPNSVKICRLRLWIELLKSTYYKEESRYTELETLPNIDINIKCGNSLISRYSMKTDFGVALKKSKSSIADYRGAVRSYHDAETKDQKRLMEKLIEDIKGNYRTEINFRDPIVLRRNKLMSELQNLHHSELIELPAAEKKARKQKQEKLESQIDELNLEIDEIRNNKLYTNSMEWRFEFPEVLNSDGQFCGFDVVIGNPPYIRVQDLDHSLTDYYKKHFSVAYKRIDISILFVELGFSILNSTGILSFISSNQFLKAEYGRNLRNFLKGHLKLNVDYSKVSVFEGLATYVSVFLITKTSQDTTEYKLMESIEDKPRDFSKFASSSFSDKSWDFNINQGLKEKIFSNKTALSEIANFTYGVITGLDDAFIVSVEKIQELKLEKDIIRKFIRPQNYKRYHIFSQTFGMIYPYRKDNSIIDELELSNNYPNCYKFLSSFKTELENRKDSRTTIKEKGLAWYSIMRRVDLGEIEVEKILFYDVGMLPNFVLDKKSHIFGGGTSHSLRVTDGSYDTKFLLGVLNSSLMEWVIYDMCPFKMGNAKKYGLDYIKKLPIPSVSSDDQLEIIKLVNEVIVSKELGKDSLDVELRINHLIYNLYDLNDDEIKLIESKR